MCCVEDGNLLIPAFGPERLDSTNKPEIFGKINIIRMN